MVNLNKYTKQGIVETAQYKKRQSELNKTPANMRMSKNTLVDKWTSKLSENDLKKTKPPEVGRAGRPRNPITKKPTTSTTSTQTAQTTSQQATPKKKRTKKTNTTNTATKNQPKITKFFKK